jgi:hypothetical protein
MPSNDSLESAAVLGLDEPQASRRTILAILSLGVAFDLAFNGQQPGISIPLFTILLAGSIRSVTRRTLETDILLAGALVLSVFPALRANEPLIALDVLAVSALLGLAVTQDLGSIASVSITGIVRRGMALLTRSLHVPRFLAGRFGEPVERRRAKVILRAALVALPIVALFASILASGDRVFARLLSSVLPEWNLESILSHIILAIVGSALVAVLWRSTSGDVGGNEPKPGVTHRPILGFAEWATVLAGIDLLFATFVVVQLAYLFGGNQRVVVTPGLTYAEYARTGFMQLAVAAALTVVLILSLWDVGRRDDARQERWFRVLVTVMVGLTGVVLISAVKRLALYEGAFGFTTARFFGYVAIVSIGAVLLVLVSAIWVGRRERVVAGFLLVAFTALLVVNVINPERFVAERNVARFDAVGKIDIDYLGVVLGSDAVPVLVALLDRLSPTDAAALRVALSCRQSLSLGPEPSWRSANLGRSSARTALGSVGITSAGCS